MMHEESLLSLMKKNFSPSTNTTDVYVLQVPVKVESRWKSELTLLKGAKQDDINKFQSLAEFADHLNMSIDSNTGSRKRKYDKSKKEVLENHSIDLHNEVFIEAALKRCLTDKKFWSGPGLLILIKSCCITQRLRDTMLELILKYEFMEAFQAISRSNIFLSSKQIVTIMKFLLSASVSKDITQLSKTLYGELSSVILLPFEEVSMRSHLRLLSTNEAAILLHFLVAALKVYSPALKSEDSSFKNSHELNETIVLKWIDSLLSAHLLSFVVSPTCTPMVEELRRLILKQKQFHRDISSLTPYLLFLQNRINLPNKYVGRYSFETITI